MKIRNGFVSNSSSSSFILEEKNKTKMVDPTPREEREHWENECGRKCCQCNVQMYWGSLNEYLMSKEPKEDFCEKCIEENDIIKNRFEILDIKEEAKRLTKKILIIERDLYKEKVRELKRENEELKEVIKAKEELEIEILNRLDKMHKKLEKVLKSLDIRNGC